MLQRRRSDNLKFCNKLFVFDNRTDFLTKKKKNLMLGHGIIFLRSALLNGFFWARLMKYLV